jgi:hypothetical protein
LERVEKISGILIFFVGVGLLIFTFFLAYTLFINPSTLLSFSGLIPNIPENEFLRLLSYLIPILLLLVMSSVAGKIALIGIKMCKLKKI